MNKVARKTPRYKKVVQRQADASKRLMDMTAINPDYYAELEFESGCTLLDLYWLDMDDEPHVMHWKYELLTKKQFVFWPWFINQKRQEDLKFVNDYAEIFDLNEKDLGTDRAQQIARADYLNEIGALLQSDNLHNRLRHYLSNSYLQL